MDLNDSWSFAINGLIGADEEAAGSPGDIKDAGWKAIVAYIHWKNKKWSLTLRGEQFVFENRLPNSEDGNAMTGDRLKFDCLTLTGSYLLNKSSQLRMETRQDRASENFYLRNGDLRQDQTTISLSWLFAI